MKREKNIALFVLALVLFAAGVFYWKFNADKRVVNKNESPAAEQTANQQNSISAEDKYRFFYNKIEENIKQENEKTADFWLARYFSMAYYNNKVHEAISNLAPLLIDYKVSSPISFLSGKYSPEFISWFAKSSYGLWDFNEENQGLDMQNNISFQLAGAQDGKYIAVIFGGYPYLEGRSVIGLPDGEIPTVILALSDLDEKIYLHAGETEEGGDKETKSYGKIEINLEGNQLQYIWQPEFYDLDNDNIPEIWIRYNKATADGFVQELAIYKIKDNNLSLFKKFTGEAEGIARRVNGNQVDVGEGVASGEGEGHLSYSKMRLETWGYENGVFRKKAENIISHILLDDSWVDYYEN